jgi:hypothetical protein
MWGRPLSFFQKPRVEAMMEIAATTWRDEKHRRTAATIFDKKTDVSF